MYALPCPDELNQGTPLGPRACLYFYRFLRLMFRHGLQGTVSLRLVATFVPNLTSTVIPPMLTGRVVILVHSGVSDIRHCRFGRLPGAESGSAVRSTENLLETAPIAEMKYHFFEAASASH